MDARKRRSLLLQAGDLTALMGNIDCLSRELDATRVQAARELGRIKMALGMPILRRRRETEVLAQAVKHAKKLGLDSNFALSRQLAAIAESCRVQIEVQQQSRQPKRRRRR